MANCVLLIGRLTADPEVRYTSATNTAIATFTVAVNRPTKEKQTDFIRVKVIGKPAETCEKYLKKGRLVGIEGRIQTGRYQNRNGDTVYTTDVVASRVEFLEWGDRPSGGQRQRDRSEQTGKDDIPPDFEEVEDDVPF